VVVYRALYGKKSTPFETRASRAHRIGMTVKVCVYGCIVSALFFVFVFTVDQLDMKRWVPLAQGVCLLISTLLSLMGLTLPPRPPETDDLVTRDQSV
jgi:Cu/Ag efflux pump CusA